jgi:uncharacterized protein (AIM24 family)
MTTAAGWYPDPSNAARHRYWDGTQWTEHVHPPEPVAPDQGAWQPQAATGQEQAATGQDHSGWAPQEQGGWPPQEQGGWTGQGQGGQAGGEQDVSAGGSAAVAPDAAATDWQAEGTTAATTVEWGAGGAGSAAGGGQTGWYGGGEAAGAAEATGPVSYESVEVASYPPAPAVAAAGAGAPQGFSAADGIGGIHTDLLADARYGEVGSGQRVVLQNARLLKVVLGDDVLARQGSMVAFQGAVDFDHEGSGASRFLKKALTGEGLPLMRCTGRGELFLADGSKNVHLIWLDQAGLSVNGRNVLAFEPTLEWDIERVQGASMVAGGLFNTRLHGSGWVAITTKGEPVVLRTDQPTFVDTDAVVAWSSGLTTSVNRTMKAKALIGKGSGEVAQLSFQGMGIVIVQPSEGDGVPPHTH